MQDETKLSPERRNFYGRIRGKTLRASQKDYLAEDLGVPSDSLDADVRSVLSQFLASEIALAEPLAEESADNATLELTGAGQAGDGHHASWHGRIHDLLGQCTLCPGIGVRSAAGVALLVRTNDEALQQHLDAVISCLPPSNATPSVTISTIDRKKPGPRRYRVFCDDVPISAMSSAAEAADRVLTELNLQTVARTTDRFIFHGGAVEREGLVVAVLGSSGLGKSTLAAALVQAGWAYLSDELVIVDPETLRVDAFPKALDLDQTSIELLGSPATIASESRGRKRQVLPSQFGATSSGGRLALMVLLDAPPGTTGPSGAGGTPSSSIADALAPIDALQGVLLNTFAQTMSRPNALRDLSRLCMAAPAIRVPRMDLRRACEAIQHAARTTTSRTKPDTRP